MDVRFSITIRQHKSLRNLIEAIPEDAWTPIPYWMDGAADVAETTCTPFQSEPDAAPVRLIVRRLKPTPGSQLALFAKYSYHGFITDRDGEMLELEADHRPPLPLSPVPLLHSHPFGGFGISEEQSQKNLFRRAILKIYDVSVVSHTEDNITCRGRALLESGNEEDLSFYFYADADGDTFVGYEAD